MFCPECGSILRPKEKGTKKFLFCSCGYTDDGDKPQAELKESVKENKKIEIIEEIETHPKIKAHCTKCGHKIAYYWTRQTRGADEPETRFFKCEECNYTWREYS